MDKICAYCGHFNEIKTPEISDNNGMIIHFTSVKLICKKNIKKLNLIETYTTGCNEYISKIDYNRKYKIERILEDD